MCHLTGAAEGQSREGKRRQFNVPERHRIPSTPSPQGLRLSSFKVGFSGFIIFCPICNSVTDHQPVCLVCSFSFSGSWSHDIAHEDRCIIVLIYTIWCPCLFNSYHVPFYNLMTNEYFFSLSCLSAPFLLSYLPFLFSFIHSVKALFWLVEIQTAIC